jgi:vacuolar protein sorting-associated protein 13A/C
VEKFIEHYKQTLAKTLLKVIGSIDIIGNPVGLVKSITSGLQDLIEKPMEGMVEGPLEVGLGIVVGCGSLVKKTFAGTCNSLNKITGSMATGLSLLTMDQSFMEKRRKFILKKPKHVFDGLKQGVESIYNGIEYGITGSVFK